MRKRTVGRGLAVAALTTTLVGTAAGTTAAAAPAVGPPYTASTATAVLRDPGLDGSVELIVTALGGSAPELTVHLFLPGLECTVSGDPTVTIDTLEAATASGTFDYSCAPAGAGQGLVPHSGTGVVDVRWIGVGEARRAALDHCVGRYLVRPTVVQGSVSLHGSTERTFDTIAADDSHLALMHSVCPPGIP